MKFEGSRKDFHALLCRMVGCRQKPKDRLWVLETEGEDEPIPKGQNMRVKLSRPIKPGFRRKVNLTPDEPLDVREDGSFAAVDIVEGNSTVSVRPESDSGKIRLYVNGDGSLGTGKVARVRADGHVGAGEAEISLELEWDVVSPDATAFSSAIEEEGEDEPIPAV